MQVKVALPPLFEEIAAAFPAARNAGVLFCWGDTIYWPQPTGAQLEPELIAHERVHSERQAGEPERWWRRYLTDAQFRLQEEIPAHVAEYVAFCANNTRGHGREARRMVLHRTAKRLASPLYGSMISYDQARALIKQSSPR